MQAHGQHCQSSVCCLQHLHSWSFVSKTLPCSITFSGTCSMDRQESCYICQLRRNDENSIKFFMKFTRKELLGVYCLLLRCEIFVVSRTLGSEGGGGHRVMDPRIRIRQRTPKQDLSHRDPFGLAPECPHLVLGV